MDLCRSYGTNSTVIFYFKKMSTLGLKNERPIEATRYFIRLLAENDELGYQISIPRPYQVQTITP